MEKWPLPTFQKTRATKQMHRRHTFLSTTPSQTDPPLQNDRSITACHRSSSFNPKHFINVILYPWHWPRHHFSEEATRTSQGQVWSLALLIQGKAPMGHFPKQLKHLFVSLCWSASEMDLVLNSLSHIWKPDLKAFANFIPLFGGNWAGLAKFSGARWLIPDNGVLCLLTAMLVGNSLPNRETVMRHLDMRGSKTKRVSR